MNENMKKMMLVLLISFLMAGASFTTPVLAVDDAPARDDASARDVTPTHIENWSVSSTLDPLIPFENCVLADMVVGSDGNTYVTGTFRDEIRFGGTTLSNLDGFAMFVAKLNSDGSWAWAVQSSGDNVHARAITFNHTEDKLYVVGNMLFYNSFDEQDLYAPVTMMFVVEVGLSSGGFSGFSMPSTGNSSAEAVIARPEGGVYITGTYNERLLLPGIQALPDPNGQNAFVASLNGSGIWLWATSTTCYFESCGNENATSLTLGYQGNLHVLGQMDDDTRFGLSSPDPVKLNVGFTDVFVWSIYPNNGSSIGVIGTNGAQSERPAAIIASGNELIVSGNFVGTMNLSGINVSSLASIFSAGFVGSLSTSGPAPNWNWVRVINGTSDSGPTSGRFTMVEFQYMPWLVTDVAAGPDGTILVGGEYWGPAQLDSVTLPGTGSNIQIDTFVAQLSSQGDWMNAMTVGGLGPDGMTRVTAAPNSQIRVAFDSDATNVTTNVTFANTTHYPSNRSVVIGTFEWDRDSDDVSDYLDNCPDTPNVNQSDFNDDGTGDACDIDDDGDGVNDGDDDCPDTPMGAQVDLNGCPDTDNDGVSDNVDICPDTPPETEVDEDGCPDTDNDGVSDNVDLCPNTPPETEVDEDGCPVSEPEQFSCEDDCPIVDSDGDGVHDGIDVCNNTAQGSYVDSTGCTDGPFIWIDDTVSLMAGDEVELRGTSSNIVGQLTISITSMDFGDTGGSSYSSGTNSVHPGDDGSWTIEWSPPLRGGEHTVTVTGSDGNSTFFTATDEFVINAVELRTAGLFRDCDPANNTTDGCEDALVAGSVGVVGGAGIATLARNWSFRGRRRGRGGLGLDKAKDAYDAYETAKDVREGTEFVSDKMAVGKAAAVGGYDHYLKPGVERQQAMSTAADAALDDYVEGDGS